MKLRISVENDLDILSTWLPTKLDAQYWAGPTTKFPIQLEEIKSQIEWKNSDSYSLVEDGVLIGFAQVLYKFSYNHICRVIISPAKRGQQLGEKLMEYIFEETQHSRKNYSLFVFEKNTPAIGLYEKLNFKIQRHPIERGCEMIDCHFMVKKGV